MKLKKFQREYESKANAREIETNLYELSVDVNELKKRTRVDYRFIPPRRSKV
jgi:hypothetical protein